MLGEIFLWNFICAVFILCPAKSFAGFSWITGHIDRDGWKSMWRLKVWEMRPSIDQYIERAPDMPISLLKQCIIVVKTGQNKAKDGYWPWKYETVHVRLCSIDTISMLTPSINLYQSERTKVLNLQNWYDFGSLTIVAACWCTKPNYIQT